jgi:hypothetical protein
LQICTISLMVQMRIDHPRLKLEKVPYSLYWENPASGRVFVKMQWFEQLDFGLSSLRTIAVSSWA